MRRWTGLDKTADLGAGRSGHAYDIPVLELDDESSDARKVVAARCAEALDRDGCDLRGFSV
ncbi:hypothetical protein OG884_13130 [Streptosporangium sp. NBC_01755]|uniref:hypothetical protein n=1 Tax=unclassified Streptosporangium TaxID=2632669 RepID=UPI002DDA6025|nr:MULTISPECIES: hypothetical protein [unclassified Streptosporangium]WSA25811.1 hypothetical protein OIE13_33735 [Streptosporangium sp. NBC_01810]WSD02798.1 hypothetical protein OG884_13130 [Streptosporangium sp. NBC_01755]